MISIDRKRARAPRRLIRDGAKDRKRIDKTLKDESRGPRSKDFAKGIYGNDEVKERLWKMQHHKCCYCEIKMGRKYASVEHFRPKSEAIRADGCRDIGYWWLAYEFRNLYFCCPACNGAKGAHFPLEEGTAAIKPRQKPWKAGTDEAPLLVDPGSDRPEAHITFVKEGRLGFMPTEKDGSIRGAATVTMARLDRDELQALRKDHLQHHLVPVVRRFREARASNDGDRMDRIRQEAVDLTKPDRRYSAMAAAVFRHYGVINEV